MNLMTKENQIDIFVCTACQTLWTSKSQNNQDFAFSLRHSLCKKKNQSVGQL